jgi:hypothetical protein
MGSTQTQGGTMFPLGGWKLSSDLWYPMGFNLLVKKDTAIFKSCTQPGKRTFARFSIQVFIRGYTTKPVPWGSLKIQVHKTS